MKICKQCGVEKQEDEFSFADKDKGYLKNKCKECIVDYSRQWQQQNREKLIAYRESTKDKQKERSRKWYLNNKEKNKKQSLEWNKNNPERRKEIRQKWDTNNRDKIRKWKKDNHDRLVSYNRNRRAKLKTSGSFTSQEVRVLYVKQKGRCFYCDCDLGDKYHRDHYIPVSKGGSNYIENIRLSCAACNLSKHNKIPEEFVA